MTAVLGIVAALAMERRWIPVPGPLIEVGGMGDARAEKAARKLIERGATALVSWGAAGGLAPDLNPGTVILPDSVISADESVLGVDLEWRDRLLERAKGNVATSTSDLFHAITVISSVEQKRRIYERFGAGATDMESMAVARVAAANHLPWIAVRVVVDAADTELPAAILTATDDDGRLRAMSAMKFFFRPRLWRSLIGMWRASAAAGRSMDLLWTAAQPDLALP